MLRLTDNRKASYWGVQIYEKYQSLVGQFNFKEENEAANNPYTILYVEFREDNANGNYCEINKSKAVGLLVDRNRINKMKNDDYDKLHNTSLDMML